MYTLKNCIRLVSCIITLSSTASAAQSLDDILSTLKDVDMNMADTGFQVDQNSYSFGAKKEIAKDTTFNLGVGAKQHNTQEYNLAHQTTQSADTRTNMIEDGFDPLNSSPMVGFSIGHKF